MNIFVVMHKVVNVYKSKGFIPLLVGAQNYKEQTNNVERDDSITDNISYKNKNFCELTGIYWMWKNNNIKDEEIIGLCHYRRYFIKNIFSVKRKNYLNCDEINKIMKKYDIILPNKRSCKVKIKDSFSTAPSKEDMKETRKCIERLYPEYIDSFDKFLNQKDAYAFNMFIATKKVMNEYFKWLFDILFEIEKVIDISEYDTYKARVYGFIAERLFNVWIEKNSNRLLIKEKYVHNETDTYLGFLKHEISNVCRRIIYGK